MNEQSSKARLYKLHPVIEFGLILSVSLGYFIVSSYQWAFSINSGTTVIDYGNHEVLQIVVYETLVLLIVLLILKWQKWSLKDFGLSFSVDKITTGLVLFVVNYIIYLLLFRVFGSLLLSSVGHSGNGPAVAFVVNIDMVPLILFSIFNPLFEEFILVGYVVSAIRNKFGLITCIILSVGFRLSFHLYQGPVILLSILPMGVIFTIYFWHKRSIIPLVIGHGLMDFISLFVFMTIKDS
jgi:CAAX protease family protein